MSAAEAIRDAKWSLHCWETSSALTKNDPELNSYAKASVKLQIATLETLQRIEAALQNAAKQ